MSTTANWTLEAAVALIRDWQPEINKAGWYLALAGGVLNRGRSKHDLDIVAVPMSTQRARIEPLHFALRKCGLCLVTKADELRERWRAHGSDDTKHVEVWDFHGARVDVIIVEAGLS